MPFVSPSCLPAKYADATSIALSNRAGDFTPLNGEKKAGKLTVHNRVSVTSLRYANGQVAAMQPCGTHSSDFHVPVGTANVSSTSRVLFTSRMLFTPAEMTITGVRDSSIRSVDTSSESSPPL